MKTVHPPEYACTQCGKVFVCRNPKDYAYKMRYDGNKRLLYFCKPSCQSRYKDEHPRKEYRRVTK